MSRYTAGLARLRCFFRVPEIGTAYAACFNFDEHFIRAGSGYRPLGHFQHTGGNDLHSAIFFIHKLHQKNLGLSDGKGDKKTGHHVIGGDSSNRFHGLFFT